MAYSTLDDIKRLTSYETLLQLCDDDQVGDIVVSPPNTAYQNVVQAIEQADNVIDSYIGGRYELPLESTPASVADCSANFALCNLFDRRRELDVPEGVEARRKRFMDWLKDIQAERAVIPELHAAKSASSKVDKTADDRMFTDTVLDQY